MKRSVAIAASIGASILLVACAPSNLHAASPGGNARNSTVMNNRSTNASRANSTSHKNTSVSSNTSSTSSKVASSKAAKSTSSTRSTDAKFKGPLPGYMLIADRGNSRLLIVTPQKKIIWSMNLGTGGHGATSRGADDAFFTPDMKHIIINEEDNNKIAIIDIAKKKIVWSYGHAGVAGSAPGYLHTPDDAYQLSNGLVTVADIRNRRILFIDKKKQIVKQYGNEQMVHRPPKSFNAPNGDTPLPNGGMIVTEINPHCADVLDKNGKLLYTVTFPDISYPSDTQMLPNGNLLTVDYHTPGKIEEITPKGKVVWEYYHKSGPGMLASPSLGIRLPNGNIAVNDDKNDRVIIINPKTKKIVWQYGHKGVAGSAPGYLNIPDGLDFAPPSWHLPKSS